jgi:hypothetical protein
MSLARVELYIGTSQSEVNKKIFDALYAHKTYIEKAYGNALLWARTNDKTVSRVYVLLDNVSISNENDWEKMINFHAESCSRMKSAFADDAVAESKKK